MQRQLRGVTAAALATAAVTQPAVALAAASVAQSSVALAATNLSPTTSTGTARDRSA